MTAHSGGHAPRSHDVTSFDRRELSVILGLYGRMVQAGAARDYAMDFLPDRAVFSIFRRASETPIYRVEKRPENARRQGAYAVLGMDGRVLKRGHELAQTLRVLDRKLIRVVD